MKYQIGTELINNAGEVVVVQDWDSDYHTRKSDYLIEVIRGVYHPVGDKAWLSSSIVESAYRPLIAHEKVLYGRQT